METLYSDQYVPHDVGFHTYIMGANSKVFLTCIKLFAEYSDRHI